MVGVPWEVQSIRGALRRGTKPRWRGVRQGILEEVTFRLRIGRISQVKGGEWPEGLQLREEPVQRPRGTEGMRLELRLRQKSGPLCSQGSTVGR